MELPNLSGPREVNVLTTAFFDEDILCGLFSSTFPDRGIITYDQIREALGSLLHSSTKFSVMYFQEEHLAL